MRLDPSKGAGKGRLGPARVPVVAVGQKQGVVAAGLRAGRAGDGDLPHAVRPVLGTLDPGLEEDPLAQSEMIDVGVEVLGDVGVLGEVGIRLGHRKVRVLHPLA